MSPARTARPNPVPIRARFLIVLMLLVAATGTVHATETCRNADVDGSPTYLYYPATTVQVGRDAQVGDVIGQWVPASANPGWICTRDPAYGGQPVLLGIQGYSPYQISRRLTFDGLPYSVYVFASAFEPVEYIVRWRATIDGKTSDWSPLVTAPGTYQNPTSFLSVTEPAGAIYPVSVEAQLRFVKGSESLSSGYRNIAADSIYLRINERNAGTYPGRPRIAQYQANQATFIGGGTCITPDVDVTLQNVNITELARNPRGPLTDFALRFQDCPAGLAEIAYRLTPTTRQVDNTPGVIALDASSTASGVGVQILDANERPVLFDTLYRLDSYNANQRGSYNVPMRAAIYKIADSVTPGSVRTAVTFTVNYR